MEINRALLTEDQRNELDMWMGLFHGPAWKALVERHEPNIQALQQAYHKVTDLRDLGIIQGGLGTLYALFVNLPDVIHYEFALLTGQIGREENGSDDDPVSPTDTSR